jgi:hypothetical protein
MDEVAREGVAFAHKRLDGINGQIASLRNEVGALRVEVAQVKTRTGLMAALGAGVASAIIAPLIVIALAIALGLRPKPSNPAQARIPAAAYGR